MLNIQILHEDDDIVVIAKPPGVVVNRAQTVSEPTIQDWIEERLSRGKQNKSWQDLLPDNFSAEFGTPEKIFAERGGIVHRLDKDTSGVMILAKNPGALINLLAQFKARTTEKHYLCLVHGKFQAQSDVIDLPMGRASRDRKLFAVQESGRSAVTGYQVNQYYPEFSVESFLSNLPKEEWQLRRHHADFTGDFRKKISVYQGFSLVECLPKTGRTHQIRVHMAHVKHPIVSDQTYVGRKRAKLDALWCPRQFLHAASLTVTHPRTGEEMTFEAPLSEDLERVLRFLG